MMMGGPTSRGAAPQLTATQIGWARKLARQPFFRCTGGYRRSGQPKLSTKTAGALIAAGLAELKSSPKAGRYITGTFKAKALDAEKARRPAPLRRPPPEERNLWWLRD